MSEYYITIRNNLVKVNGDKIFILGRLAESNKKSFDLMLHDNVYNYLYIDRSGNILSSANKKVGKITNHQR